MQTIEEYAMEHGLSFKEAQERMENAPPKPDEQTEDTPKRRSRRKVVDE